MTIKRLGIDFHGVINTAPDYFTALAETAVAQGIEVHVISGGPRQYIADYLRQINFPPHQLWCIIDVPEVNDKTQFFADGSFRVADELWDKAKGEYCQSQRIDVHIDDSAIYGRYFTTPYCRYVAAEKRLRCGNKVMTALPPAELLQALQEFAQGVK